MPDIENHVAVGRWRGKAAAAVAGIALLAVGGSVGAVAMHATRPSVAMAPATPVAIRSLQSEQIVTIKGQVAEIYGNKFIVQDQSGRALVETGREGEDGELVTKGELVTVQGRFDEGFVRAAFLVGPDARVIALGPLGGPHDAHDHRRPRHGPEDGPDAPPPPSDMDGDQAPASPAGPAPSVMPSRG
ncbi:hypothetical protein HL653_17630 [Sphingomonas sp. AP4-R1]|uniref:hypothetical protein n=1 Tax=Sphingomonas sp. AP4-R1 TaxID=2735134 RepID=UPI0014935645|nr:hypothetical protein [Sphingomonas sp. AP4-R1]QJU59337.1 hypothetical protein HL653_17630 [Sphingomonas sp. AP4-R1]